MAMIAEIAEKFFEACEAGKGWEVCRFDQSQPTAALEKLWWCFFERSPSERAVSMTPQSKV